jgi:hypothetical protein
MGSDYSDKDEKVKEGDRLCFNSFIMSIQLYFAAYLTNFVSIA